MIHTSKEYNPPLILFILSTFFIHGVHNEIFTVRLTRPSGLAFTTDAPVHRCLLQRNCISLREKYRDVHEYIEALPMSKCQGLVENAEMYAKTHVGWTANRHSGYPTTDLPLEEIVGRFSDVHGFVNAQIIPEIASKFSLNEDFLSIGELFVAKYEFGVNRQASLGSHRDGTPWSFVLALNDPRDFEGGGTLFTATNRLHRAKDVGTAFLFSGQNEHEGVAVTKGVRYILAGFINYIDPDISHEHFMSSYDPEHDGMAAACGLQTGDILRGIVSWDGRRLAEFEDSTDIVAIQQTLRRHGSAELRRSGFCDLLIEREDDNNDSRMFTKSMSWRLLSTGKYWGLDDYLDY